MKKWAQKLSRDVKETLKLDSDPKFRGQGRRLGEAGPSRPPVPSGAPNPSTSAVRTKETGSAAVHSSPYHAVLRSINDDDCVSALATMLRSVDRSRREREETQESLTVLRRILSNVMADPSNDKVRTLRLSNAKIDRYVVRPEGARELLMGCGFIEVNDTGVGVEGASLVMPCDVARDRLSLMRRVVRVIETLLGTQAAPRNASDPTVPAARTPSEKNEPGAMDKVMGAGRRRNTMLELPSAVEDADLPEEFYRQSLSEVQKLYQHDRQVLEQSKVLMTKAMRDKLQSKGDVKLDKAWVRVRVRAPEAMKIVGDFHRDETLLAVFSWVAECLNERIVEFDLVTPPPERRSVGDLRFDGKCTLRDVFGTGDVTLNLVINGGEGACGREGPTFKSVQTVD